MKNTFFTYGVCISLHCLILGGPQLQADDCKPKEKLTNDDLIALLKAGSTADEIMALLAKNICPDQYANSFREVSDDPAALHELKDAGANAELLAAIIGHDARPDWPLQYNVVEKLLEVDIPSEEIVPVVKKHGYGGLRDAETLLKLKQKGAEVSLLTELKKNEKNLPQVGLVPSVPGFVPSPFTHPPTFVDIKGAKPGSMVTCPYTGEAFMIAMEPSKEWAGKKKPLTVNDVVEMLKAGNSTQQIVTALWERGRFELANTEETAAALKKAGADVIVCQLMGMHVEVTEIPYGKSLPGRPGYVNSPYALSHQLIDVTGLPTGMELKCPYSGFLFRVPPQ